MIFFFKNVLIPLASYFLFLNWNLFLFFLNNCLELEKEIEELKSKPGAGGTDEVIKVMKQL